MKKLKKFMLLASVLALTAVTPTLVNATTHTKTTNASYSWLNIEGVSDHVYFSYTGSSITSASAYQSSYCFYPLNFVRQDGITLIGRSGSWARLYQGKYTVGEGINARKYGKVGISFNEIVRTTILGNGQWTFCNHPE